MKILNKETLKEFIETYPTNYKDQSYVNGIKTVLADLEATFLWEANNTESSLNEYLKEENNIAKAIEENKKTNLSMWSTIVQSMCDPNYVPF